MKIYPPHIVLGSLLLCTILNYFYPYERIIAFPNNLFGIALAIFSIFLGAKSFALFKKYKTNIKPDDKPLKFIKGGAYHYTRNPIYVSMLLLLLGIAIVVGKTIFFIGPAIFFALANFYFIPFEEKNLKKAFGKKYLEYKKEVGRWI